MGKINKNLAIQKKLIVNNNYSLYISIKNVYKYFFEKNLLNMVDLKKYDVMIKNSNLDFGISKCNDNQMYTNNLNCNYIYLINNFFVEKLSTYSLNLFMKYLNKEEIDLNMLYNVVNNTYKEVIKDNYKDNKYVDKSYKVCYGKDKLDNFIYNDRLVFKIVYSKNTRQLSDDEYIKNLVEKREFLDKIKNNIENDIKDKLNIFCDVIIEKRLN